MNHVAAPLHAVGRIDGRTLGLFSFALAIWTSSSALGLLGVWSYGWTSAFNCIAAFLMFSVSHEGAHGALSSSRAITLLLGRVATIFFAPQAGFQTFRFIHMQHHRFTNEADGRDPDLYTHSGPRWQLPLRWFTVDLHYMIFYYRVLSTRPRGERLELYATWLFTIALATVSIATGHAREWFYLYLLPQRMAVGLLAFSFDYLPHVGLEHFTAESDRYKATRNVLGRDALLGLLLQGQNYHLIHHLHPRLPFHRLRTTWRTNESAYRAREPSLTQLR
jgi:fatty acid desaturase